MSQTSCDFPHKPYEKRMSVCVLSDPNDMVRQMVLPLADEHGRERAIEMVARICGLSYSKTYRLFYGQSTDVWSKQKQKLTAAFKSFAASQERLYRERAERYAAVHREIERIERQHGLDLDFASQVVGGGLDGASLNAS